MVCKVKRFKFKGTKKGYIKKDEKREQGTRELILLSIR